MVRITIDEQLKQKLLASDEPAELCDAAGNVIARARSVPQSAEDAKSLFPELTREEIDRRCDEAGEWLTTEEAINFLSSRGKPA